MWGVFGVDPEGSGDGLMFPSIERFPVCLHIFYILPFSISGLSDFDR